MAIDQPAIIIQDDRGGQVGDYIIAVSKAKRIHAQVKIEGDCFSSCTLWLSMPRQDICITPKTKFGFHSTSIPATDGVLMAYYPQVIKSWLDNRLPIQPVYLHADSLRHYYKQCED